MPMTLFLYNKSDEDGFDSVFSWSPYTKQWWITGFNPKYIGNVYFDSLIMIGKIDMSIFTDENGDNKMFSGFVHDMNTIDENSDLLECLYFDDESSTIWIMWGA